MTDYATMSADQLLTLATQDHDLQGIPDKALSHLVANVVQPDTPMPQVDGRGRPAYDNPQDPIQLPAIIRRCQEHYLHVPTLQTYVKVTKKELLRVVKESTLLQFDARVEQYKVSGKPFFRLVVG